MVGDGSSGQILWGLIAIVRTFFFFFFFLPNMKLVVSFKLLNNKILL